MSDTLNTIWYTRCPVPTAFGIAIANGLLAAEQALQKLKQG